MKSKIILLTLAFLLCLPLAACAMGPIYIGAHTATWDAVTGTTGYRIYWRAPGTTTWVDAQRVQTTTTTLNLIDAGVPVGSWEICATAFDTVSESGPSNVVPWNYTIRNAPANTKVQ